MAVRVSSNNLDAAVRAEVEKAVLEAIGERSGEWGVALYVDSNSKSWRIMISGPNNYLWNRSFRAEEQKGLDNYRSIREAILEALSHTRLNVYLSHAEPDDDHGFVSTLIALLRTELHIQTGEAVEIVSTRDRRAQSARGPQHEQELLAPAKVFIPILSPSYFTSSVCQTELKSADERRLPICSVYFVTASQLEHANTEPQFNRRVDFRQHRFDLTSRKAREAIVALAKSIIAAKSVARARQAAQAEEPIFLDSLKIENFRCFERIELRFDRQSSLEGRWTCIAGVNGSGKSTILQAIGVALLGNPLALELGGERLNRMRRTSEALVHPRAKIRLELRGANSNQQPILELAIDKGRIVSTSGPSWGEPLATLPLARWEPVRRVLVAGYGATRNLSARIDSSNENLSPDVRRLITLFDPLSQLPGAEVLLGRQSAERKFLELFQTVVQQVFDTELQISRSGSPSGIRFTVSNKDDVEAIDLPDGFRSAAAWLADMCAIWCEKAPDLAESRDPADIFGIVLIDEIDLHLHPSLQRSLIPRLRKTFPKVQWIITTHSPLVLANFDVNEIIALDRDREGNIRELDRQILNFTTDEIYEWLMGTRPTGAEFDDQLRKSDEGTGKDQEELARMMRVSPETNEEDARKQVAEFKEILRSLKL